MEKIIIIYLILVNIIAYISMWSDKKRAINHKYRISEKTLFTIAIIGGSLGSILGMKKFHHKTKHWYFKYGMPLILIIQIIIIVTLVGTGL
nr:DUF1294 domain-containing protein [uncultured Cellulosilyticum sp.]